jgi:hypothetical protein
LFDSSQLAKVSGSGNLRRLPIGGFGDSSCQHRRVLAALNFGAVALGVASGSLTASVLALLIGGGLTIAGIDTGPDIGLVIGILVGLGVGGWVAGAKAKHSERFHGAVTGLLIAFLIMVIARFGGSPAPTPTIVWLAVLSILVSGVAGWLAGRRKLTKP